MFLNFEQKCALCSHEIVLIKKSVIVLDRIQGSAIPVQVQRVFVWCSLLNGYLLQRNYSSTIDWIESDDVMEQSANHVSLLKDEIRSEIEDSERWEKFCKGSLQRPNLRAVSIFDSDGFCLLR